MEESYLLLQKIIKSKKYQNSEQMKHFQTSVIDDQNKIYKIESLSKKIQQKQQNQSNKKSNSSLS